MVCKIKQLFFYTLFWCITAEIYAQRTDSYSHHIIYDGDNFFYKASILDTTGGLNYGVQIGKYDSLHNEEWSYLYGGIGKEYVNRFTTAGGNYYALGYTFSKGAGLNDMLVTKASPTGFEKALILGEGDADEAVNLLEQDFIGQELLLLGTTQVSIGNNDAVYTNLDSSLNPTNSFRIDLAGKDLLSVGAILPDKSKILAGKTNLFGGDEDDILVVKIDSSNQLAWVRRLYSGNREEINDILVVQDKVYLAGYQVQGSAYQGIIVEMDTSGLLISQRAYGSFVGNRFLKMIFKEGNLVIAGAISTITGNYDDFLLLEIDSLGEIWWSFEYGYLNDEYPTHLSKSDTGYVMSGPVKIPGGWSYQVVETGEWGNSCNSVLATLDSVGILLQVDTLIGTINSFVYQYQIDTLATEYPDTSYQNQLCLLRRPTQQKEPPEGLSDEDINSNIDVRYDKTSGILLIESQNDTGLDYLVRITDYLGRILFETETASRQRIVQVRDLSSNCTPLLIQVIDSDHIYTTKIIP